MTSRFEESSHVIDFAGADAARAAVGAGACAIGAAGATEATGAAAIGAEWIREKRSRICDATSCARFGEISRALTMTEQRIMNEPSARMPRNRLKPIESQAAWIETAIARPTTIVLTRFAGFSTARP